MTADQPRQPQTFVLRAEVVDTSHKVHAGLQGLALSGESSRSSGQAVHTTAKRPIDALYESGVDIAFALRPFDHICNRFFGSLIDLAGHADDAIAFMLLDHLRDQNVGPFDKPASSCFLARLFLAKDFQDRRRITRQSIRAEENRPAKRRGAAFDAADKLLDQFAVSMLTNFSTQPQSGRDHHGHSHPDDRALHLDAQFIGLHLAQGPRLLDQMLMHLLRVLAAFLNPVLDRSLIEAEGGDNRLHRAAKREQVDNQRDDIAWFSQAVENRSCCGTERRAALPADVAAVFLGMHTNVAFSKLSSGGTVGVGTKCGFWAQRRFFFLIMIMHREISSLDLRIFQRAIRPRLNVGLPRNDSIVIGPAEASGSQWKIDYALAICRADSRYIATFALCRHTASRRQGSCGAAGKKFTLLP